MIKGPPPPRIKSKLRMGKWFCTDDLKQGESHVLDALASISSAPSNFLAEKITPPPIDLIRATVGERG